MKLTDFIPKEGVLCDLKARDKDSFLKEISFHLGKILQRSSEEIERVLLERERLGSTAIGNEIAIPHSRMEDLERMVVLLARKPQGLDFEALDGRPVKLFFVVLAPDKEAGTYLKTLAHIASLLKRPKVKERLLQASSPREIIEILSEVDYDY